MHENRETSETPAAQPGSRSAGEGSGHTARVHVCEESHSGIVPMNYSVTPQFVGADFLRYLAIRFLRFPCCWASVKSRNAFAGWDRILARVDRVGILSRPDGAVIFCGAMMSVPPLSGSGWGLRICVFQAWEGLFVRCSLSVHGQSRRKESSAREME